MSLRVLDRWGHEHVGRQALTSAGMALGLVVVLARRGIGVRRQLVAVGGAGAAAGDAELRANVVLASVQTTAAAKSARDRR